MPVGPGQPPWEPDEPLVRHLVRNGYAVAGSANTIFWPLERVFADQPALLDVAHGILGSPRHTILLGLSIGGIISAGTVQRFPDRLSGALPMGGNVAGAVSNHNRELDIAFVVKTLLAPDSTLRVVGITDSQANLALATRVLHEAQATAAGRARLALAAAVGNIPGWYHPTSPQPAPDDFDARQRNQFAWFEAVGFLVFFLARKQVEMQARGNPSWNTGVDYRELVSGSINRDEVAALYAAANLDLDEDLDRLAAGDRIEADPDAVAYLEEHIVFNGDLNGVPVLTVHTDGDGLVTPDHERAYADVVTHAGHQDHLRQLYVHRGGHCTFTFAEVLTAVDVLIERIQGGAWPDLDPQSLNEAAQRWGAEENVLVGGEATQPQFFPFGPWPFPRRYDARDVVSKAPHVMNERRDASVHTIPAALYG
ncbi:MAG: hypothetical protein LC733_11295 [Actinobacteria bacterium]|nr:hypothetical protein [Actinomycetota bacterium]